VLSSIHLRVVGLLLCLAATCASCAAPAPQRERHTFEIGDTDFLLDGRPFVIRSGEMHANRIPRECWRQRLKMARALGLNTVCAYLFWNRHEAQRGRFDFAGWNDMAEYCRIAQEEGLWVILRPGPYSCAEWEFGGFPAWLLETPDIQLRSRDPRFFDAARRYLLEVGRELAPLQVTRGGPILMVQVENEYGSYGRDKEYIGALRDVLREAGFEVPLFTCDGPSQLVNDTRDDLFCVVNFGSDPQANFAALRKVRPAGPAMCGEYYPGWFDSWGKPHHVGDTQRIVAELGSMLEARQSFSIYMVHGGTSFGFSSGANAPPFAPQSTSYDYDAPIDEAGRATAKFHALRELFSRHLEPGETLPPIPPPQPITSFAPVRLDERAELFAHLGSPRFAVEPRTMEALGQATGVVVYRHDLGAGPAGTLTIREPHDVARVYLDGRLVGTVDRRFKKSTVELPARVFSSSRLDIAVEALGRVCYGGELADRKGLLKPVELTTNGATRVLEGWNAFSVPLDERWLAALEFQRADASPAAPAVWRGTFELAEPGDTWLDLRAWSRGMVWVNGHALGRYWRIGPQQTLYLPGCWTRAGANELLVLDVDGGVGEPVIAGLAAPILDDVQPDFAAPKLHRKPQETLDLTAVAPAAEFTFADAREWQRVELGARGRWLCLEALASTRADPFTTVAELELVAADGAKLALAPENVVFADSEELGGDDGNAGNALDGDPATFWHTEWASAQPKHPHRLVIDLGSERELAALRYLARQDSPNGRLAQVRVYVSGTPFAGLR
jgi:beta-galactosidase